MPDTGDSLDTRENVNILRGGVDKVQVAIQSRAISAFAFGISFYSSIVAEELLSDRKSVRRVSRARIFES